MVTLPDDMQEPSEHCLTKEGGARYTPCRYFPETFSRVPGSSPALAGRQDAEHGIHQPRGIDRGSGKRIHD